MAGPPHDCCFYITTLTKYRLSVTADRYEQWPRSFAHYFVLKMRGSRRRRGIGIVAFTAGAAISQCRLGEAFVPSPPPLFLHHSKFTLHASPTNTEIGNESSSNVQNADSDEDAEQAEKRHLRFSGVGRLYSSGTEESATAHLDIVDKLAASTCAVFGIGGVGTWAAEALCRSGVGHMILIDMDEICTSNLNRQLHATTSTIGKSKIHEMERRLLDINPNLNTTTIFDFLTLDNVDEMMDLLPPDCIVLDCIDGQREKAALIVACYERGMPVVTCGGAAGRKDPTKIECDDLTLAQEDRLLFRCRKLLRKEYGWPKGPAQGEKNSHKVKPWGIPAVFSTEIQKSVDQSATGSLRRCDGALGTACYLTGAYGFVAASRVIDMIAEDKRVIPVKPNR